MVLVDTSVLIGYLKGEKGFPYNVFDEMVDYGIPFGINKLIYQEILQGARNIVEFDTLKEYLSTMKFYELRAGISSYEKAAYMYFKCRKSGITIRSTIDLLIAETAIENDLYLLHNDNDFVNISKMFKDLKLYI